jgi:hypothetical protein
VGCSARHGPKPNDSVQKLRSTVSHERQPLGVRQVQDDKAVGLVGVRHGEGPGDEAAPVVPDDDGLVLLEVLYHRRDVADEFLDGVVRDARRLAMRIPIEANRTSLKVPQDDIIFLLDWGNLAPVPRYARRPSTYSSTARLASASPAPVSSRYALMAAILRAGPSSANPCHAAFGVGV